MIYTLLALLVLTTVALLKTRSKLSKQAEELKKITNSYEALLDKHTISLELQLKRASTTQKLTSVTLDLFENLARYEDRYTINKYHDRLREVAKEYKETT